MNKKDNPEFVDYEALYKEALSAIKKLEAKKDKLIKKIAINEERRQYMEALQKFYISLTAARYGRDNILNNKVSYSQIAKDFAGVGIKLKLDPRTIKSLLQEAMHHLNNDKPSFS